MNGKNDFLAQVVWDLAQESRCCPPDSELFVDELSEQAIQHISCCHRCTSRLEEGPQDSLEELSELFLAESLTTDTSPAPGQICKIRAELEGWWEGTRYYRSPVVFILERLPHDGLLVAQVSGFDLFSWKHDIPLEGGLTGVVQAWHTYPLQTEDIGPCLGVETDNFLAKVLSEVQLSGENDAEELPPMVQLFRHMELETSIYFSIAAALRLAQCQDDTKSTKVARRKGKLIPFPLQQNTERIPSIINPEHYLKAAASLSLTFTGENDFFCEAKYDTETHYFTFSAERTPDGKPIFAAIWNKKDERYISFQQPDTEEAVEAITLKSGDEEFVRIHNLNELEIEKLEPLLELQIFQDKK